MPKSIKPLQIILQGFWWVLFSHGLRTKIILLRTGLILTTSPVCYIDAAVRYRRTDIAGLRIAYLRPGNKVICCIRMYILS